MARSALFGGAIIRHMDSVTLTKLRTVGIMPIQNSNQIVAGRGRRPQIPFSRGLHHVHHEAAGPGQRCSFARNLVGRLRRWGWRGPTGGSDGGGNTSTPPPAPESQPIDRTRPSVTKPGQLLVILANSLYYASEGRVALIDITSGNWIWRSPVLHGIPLTDSLHYNAAAPNGGSISIGTRSAMYITR